MVSGVELPPYGDPQLSVPWRSSLFRTDSVSDVFSTAEYGEKADGH